MLVPSRVQLLLLHGAGSFGLFVLTLAACERQASPAKPVQWEYARVSDTNLPSSDLSVALPDSFFHRSQPGFSKRFGNDTTMTIAFDVFQVLGREGWEMVGCIEVPGEGNAGYMCDFKRPRR
jgi:hypothetical protein